MGRRWGKTYMCGAYALAVADFGGSVAWVAPSYKNSRPMWRFVERHVSQAPRVELLRSLRTAEFPSGGRIAIHSGDNNGDSLRSEDFDLVIVDEAARVTEAAIYDAIMPTLADRGGRLVAISTPKGRNWFYREFMRAKNGAKDYAAFTAPSVANPIRTIQEAYWRAKDLVSSRTWRQEWNAEFVDDTGGTFRGVRALATATRRDVAQDGHYYTFGVDWGRTNDFTVITVLDTSAQEVVARDRFTDTDWLTQMNRVVSLANKFKPYAIWAESNSMGGPLAEALAQRGLPIRPFVTTNESKRAIIDALALAFEGGKLRITDDEDLLTELEAYETKTTRLGTVTSGAPPGLHDDGVISLALAWQGLTSGSVFL